MQSAFKLELELGCQSFLELLCVKLLHLAQCKEEATEGNLLFCLGLFIKQLR